MIILHISLISENKPKIASAGAIPKLIFLSSSKTIPVKIEAIAALANLAVNDNNEIEIVNLNGLDPIVASTAQAALGLEDLDSRTDREITLLEELATQCARALRNLSVNGLISYNHPSFIH